MARGPTAQEQALDHFLESCDYEEVPDPTREEVERNLHLVRDPKDVPIALAAIEAGVDVFVTNDTDFTDRDESTAVLRTKLDPMPVGRFLHDVMGWSSSDLERIRRRNWDDVESDQG